MQSGESGKLKVEVVEGKNIPAPDGRPTADTYVTLTITGEKKKTLSEKTKVQKKGLESPKWAQSFEFSIDHHATELQIQVQDWNRIVASEILASATVSITKDLVSGTAIDKWFPLTKPNSKSKSGELHLKLSISKKSKKGDNGSKAQLSPAPTDGRRPSVKGNDPSTGSLRTGKSEKSDPEIFKYVRENNFDKLCEYLRNAPSLAVNELDSYGYTPLQVACSNKEGDERIIARLLEVPGVDVATPIKSDNNTALHYFCQYYKSPLDADELFQMFIKLGADVNAKNNNHETPIFKAIWNTSIKLLLVEKLLECGAEVNIFNIPHGKSVLHYAVHLQREDLMHLFLKAGADITAKGKTDNKTPYELANDMKQTKMAETLRAVQELHEWLTSIGCGQWKEAFMKKEIFTKQQLLQADLEKPALEAIGLTDKELRHKLHKAAKSLKKENKGSEGPTTQEDSSAVLTKILADLEAMGIKKNEFILSHKDLEFTKKLGSGAAGDVFKGLFKGIPVAIKVLKESMAEKELAEFKKEFFILASVRSPYTVHFFGAAFGQKLEMVMELCSRGSLYDVMRDPSVSLGWSQFFAMSLECSLGLEVLHNHTPQIVHRDLKSLNLLVTQDWHVKVCDFGLSRFDTQANDETLHQLRGTMAFCLVSDTPVTLASGISMKIKDLAGLPEVLTLSANGNFVPARPSAHLVQGRRECIELLFSDGRTLVCTPDHEIRTTDGWRRADALVKGESRVLLGVEAPLYDPTEDDPAHLAAFQLEVGQETLRMSNPQGVARAHALARILGSLYTDGSASYNEVNNSFKGDLHLGHCIDVDQAKKDLMLVLGECGKVKEPSPKRNHYKVSLPSHFIHALHNHPKIHLPVGERKYLAYLLPELVTDPACPKSFVREFLGGLFGGDGSAPLPNSNDSGWLSVKFFMIKEAAVSDSRDAIYRQIIALLARFNITKVTMDSEQDMTDNHPDSKPEPGERMLSRTLCLSTDEIVAFQERVGFRYCAHKQQRLTVAAAFCRADDHSRKRAQELVNRVDEMTGYSNASKQEGKRPKLKMSISKAYDVVVNDMKKAGLFLNEKVAIPMILQVQDVLKGKFPLEGIISKSGSIKPYDFIAAAGATRFFSDSPCALAAASSNKQADEVRDGVNRELAGFPTWTATFVGSKAAGVQDVYDISVPMTESFLAMGVTVHNCAPEVYHSSKFTPKSDVFSLVIVLWELINRIIKGVYEAPYSEFKHLQYDFQIIIQVAKKNLRPTIPPTTPPQLVELLKRGMDADPEKRPALREFIEKLTGFQKEFASNSQVWDRALLDGRALSRGEKTLSSLGLNQPTAAGN